MRLPAFLIAATMLVSPAQAEVAVFDLGPGRRNTRMVSADGYHYATFRAAGEKANWSVDGRVVLEGGAANMLDRGHAGPDQFADLSSDGRVLLNVLRAPRDDGSFGFLPVVNGRPFGKPFAALKGAQVGRNGSNVVFLAGEIGKGCFVLSAAGAGPAFPECPAPVIAADEGVIYLAKWNNRTYLYRDHKPVMEKDYRNIAASPDLSRFAGFLDDGKEFHSIEIGSKIVAKRRSLGAMVFSPDGRHFAVVGGETGSTVDSVIVDGKSYPASGAIYQIALSPGDGLPYWVADEHFYAAGKDRGRVGSISGGGRSDGRWLAFNPSGRNHVFVAWDENVKAEKLFVDGEVAQEGVPSLLDDARVVFDGENEFHYLGWRKADDSIYLVCGTVDGSSPRRTKCARIAASRQPKAEN